MSNTRIVPTYVVKVRNANTDTWERVSVQYASREYALEVCLRLQHAQPLLTYTVVTVNTAVWMT